ncbi:MAG: tRNA (N6-threonylcarbamoyladenosine(37)-N6)-methyltransferase TrmO [Eubacteriaceae bacterium]|nr:tRNA (N6-threonylcarbamoyladenosine(37)-N6)-methyltransferase TrmO [Eubacteriaceae bacterium]
MKAGFTFVPVGVIHSPYRELSEIPRQGYLSGDLTAELEVFEEYAPAASSMKPGEKYCLLFVFDKSEGYDLLTTTKGGEGEVKGFFSSRSPKRINPIGLTDITVTAVDGRFITFTGVDMLDGTPVLDIKPAM